MVAAAADVSVDVFRAENDENTNETTTAALHTFTLNIASGYARTETHANVCRSSSGGLKETGGCTRYERVRT